MRLFVSLSVLLVSQLVASHASAQTEPLRVSQCLAIAQALPGATYADYSPARDQAPFRRAQGSGEVDIFYAGHSTYVITTPAGVTIATDYNGWAGSGATPRVVTMNRAHSSHYTSNPDPEIEHVLPGWGENGEPARHALVVDDVFIRNVTTDIRGYEGREKDANSIFVFEVADLCIGHLGHLHHELDDTHFAAIGRLDIVMVPVDNGLTQSQASMAEIARRLRTSIVLPMHRMNTPLSNFIQLMGEDFVTDYQSERSFTVSLATLPRRPTIVILKGV